MPPLDMWKNRKERENKELVERKGRREGGEREKEIISSQGEGKTTTV